jgi:hypothetical protein
VHIAVAAAIRCRLACDRCDRCAVSTHHTSGAAWATHCMLCAAIQWTHSTAMHVCAMHATAPGQLPFPQPTRQALRPPHMACRCCTGSSIEPAGVERLAGASAPTVAEQQQQQHGSHRDGRGLRGSARSHANTGYMSLATPCAPLANVRQGRPRAAA